MTVARRGENGVAWRYVPQGKIDTLFGPDVRKRRCNKCHQEKNQSEFYHSGNGKPFGHCITCDDTRRKRDAKIQRLREKGIIVDKNFQPIERATLDFLLEDD